ncbi:MurR/RpiR family transcriptional regulator [Planctomonas psychrotolerans]|uniref:MurR/RpiR family transcriptional regulator n=1 Tax=Planctomonas psychrotolerans TaxID=2528712 RepID=UPI001D0D2934|nr:MurR/RpiR family transcriptional regulator [Planctomonas psychrotolerans]
MSSLTDRIAAGYTELSPQERRAADFLRDNEGDLAFYTATEVATRSGVSKATVSRLYRRLGFESAEALRAHVRNIRASGTPLRRGVPQGYESHLDQEVANLRRALDSVDVAPAARAIAGGAAVLVLGFRTSHAMALHLRQQLAQCRPGVRLGPVPGQSVGEELAGLSSDDVVVLVGFRRRPRGFAAVLDRVASSPATLVLLTDSTGHRYAARADHVLECPVDSVSAFDSYAAAASVISILAAAVLDEHAVEGRTRLEEVGRAFRDLDELEAP